MLKHFSTLLLVCLLSGCSLLNFFRPKPDPFYATILKTDKDNPAALFAEGQRLMGQGRYAEAEAFFLRLTEIQSDHVTGWDALGRCRLEQTHFTLAAEAFEHELALKQTEEGLLGLAEANLMLGKMNEAKVMGDRSEKGFGKTAALVRLRGDIAYKNHEFAQAQALYAESLKLNPEQAGLQIRLRDLKDYLAQ